MQVQCVRDIPWVGWERGNVVEGGSLKAGLGGGLSMWDWGLWRGVRLFGFAMLGAGGGGDGASIGGYVAL